jgi:hypothetical protein
MSTPTHRLFVIVAAAAAVSGSLFAQPEVAATNAPPQPTEQRQQAIAELEREIQAIESREGPTSAQLTDPLSSLGFIYQQAGEHLLAERHPDTVQTAEILHETADRRVEMLMRYSTLALLDLAAEKVIGLLVDGQHLLVGLAIA